MDLDPKTVEAAITPKMRKELSLAHELAAQENDLDFYKGVLQQFQDELIEKQKAQEAAKAKAASTPKKAAKKEKVAKPSANLDDDEEDVEMVDVDDEEPVKAKKGSSKRAAEDEEVSSTDH